MSANTDLILERVPKLSTNELLVVQKAIAEELERKKDPTQTNINSIEQSHRIYLPHSYRITFEEAEDLLAGMFSSEELSELSKPDLTQLPVGPKSTSEMLIEDRENYF